MNEATLKEIITRILSSPELQSLLAVSSAGQGTKPGCLILLNDQEGVGQLAALEERYRQDYSLGVCVVGPVELAENKISRVSCEQVMREPHWERIHVPVCSADQLAQIALGLCTDQTSKLVAWAIIAGIPVEIGRVDLGFTARTSARYRQMFENYVRQVAGFGVIIAENYCTAQQLAPVLSLLAEPQSSQAPLERQSHPDVRYNKRLLSAKEALRLPGNGVLRIAKSTVLTPTAIDVLKKQKVEVYREGVRCL
ncbi:MAG TPA: hypothetical protein VGL27_01380 [Negativicutes bacterium]|jgi:hypothetical protein